MVLELPTTLIDLSAMENSMARMMLETINNMMIELYASMAQAEIEKKEKRQREGIEQKKARGEWDDYGTPVAVPADASASRTNGHTFWLSPVFGAFVFSVVFSGVLASFISTFWTSIVSFNVNVTSSAIS